MKIGKKEPCLSFFFVCMKNLCHFFSIHFFPSPQRLKTEDFFHRTMNLCHFFKSTFYSLSLVCSDFELLWYNMFSETAEHQLSNGVSHLILWQFWNFDFFASYLRPAKHKIFFFLRPEHFPTQPFCQKCILKGHYTP